MSETTNKHLKKRFNKLLIIDISLDNDDMTEEIVMGKLSRIIKNVSIYQNVVILSHGSLYILKQLIQDMKIKKGYIISDGGARIFDITNQTIIFESSISLSNLKAAIHNAIMLNMLILTSTNTKEYAYSLDLTNNLNFSKHHYLPIEITNDFERFQKYVYSNRVFSLLCFFKEPSMLNKKFELYKRCLDDWSLSACDSYSTFFQITDQSISKFNSILKLIEICQIKSFDDVYYCAINNLDNQCYKAFKNKAVCRDIFFNLVNIDYRIEILSIDSIINFINNKLINQSLKEQEIDYRAASKPENVFNTSKIKFNS